MKETLIPIRERSVVIKHKIINEQPHIEIIGHDTRVGFIPRLQDSVTLSATQDQELQHIIRSWMYE